MDYHYFGDKGRAEGLLVAAVHVESDNLYAGFCMTPVGKCYVQGFAQIAAEYRLEFARTGAWNQDGYTEAFTRYANSRPDLRTACLAIEDFETPDYSVVLDLPDEARDWIGHKVVLLEYLCSGRNPMAPSTRKFIRELWLESAVRYGEQDVTPEDLEMLSSYAGVSGEIDACTHDACTHDHAHQADLEFPS